MSRPRLATLWLDGCSGCHMSLLDLDERLLEIAERFELLYSPLVDHKTFPEAVEVTLIEGALSSREDAALLHLVRQRSGLLVALGDCAVTGNIPSLRNPLGMAQLLQSVYRHPDGRRPPGAAAELPHCNEQAQPLHSAVAVDLFIPGCPPDPDLLYALLIELAAGRTPEPPLASRFGA